MESMSQTERFQLCDAALAAGPEAPTLCGEWSVKDLVIHLLVRERDPLGAPGILLPPLEGLTRRSSRRLADTEFSTLVERVRNGPPRWSPLALGAVDRMVNTLEYFVHLEDIRRARSDWAPRDLSQHEQTSIWKAIALQGRGLVRAAAVPLEIRWPGEDGTSTRSAVLRKGAEPVVLSGPPSELALFLFGRKQLRGLSYAGPPGRIAKLTEAKLGI